MGSDEALRSATLELIGVYRDYQRGVLAKADAVRAVRHMAQALGLEPQDLCRAVQPKG